MTHTTHRSWDIQQLIGNTLRIGVFTACAIAAIGGIIYLLAHGAEPMPDYTHFSYADAHTLHTDYTSLPGILHGLTQLRATSIIQTGVIALLLTPILRVVLSLVDFLRERDWLYAAITAIVLAIIIMNSLSFSA